MNISEKLLNFRKENNLTQGELGERIGVSAKVISKWETGESLPATELLPSLADCLDVSVDWLFDRQTRAEYDICKTANAYFRSIPSDAAVSELQSLISYSIEGIAYKHSQERGWYKPEILAEIDSEWLELIKNKDSRPQMHYDNRQMLKELVVNVDNNKLKFVALQSFKDNSFLTVLDRYECYLPLLKALSVDGTDRMLKYLFSDNAPKQLTAEHLSEKTRVSVDKAESFLVTLHGVFKDNLPAIRQACIGGESHTVYPNPATNKLQLLLVASYFAAEDWQGER